MEAPQRRPIALWGGVECTVNRVGDRYHDQLARSRHGLDDLDRFADLGLQTLRVPVLWEHVAPDGVPDWRATDALMERLRRLAIRPIVGLVHHGSGPRATSLVDAGFASGLAAFARAVAERYPDVDAYTPVNEPLTTARFSGLYGHWYPHGRDERTFARALVVQIRAVADAMAAIREVQPAAHLIQTDDLGRTWSTPSLAGQAAMENERRWLTWDLLCGRVTRDHAMWERLRLWGIGEAELDAFAERPCPPDVIGVNYYLTSERFLDDRLEHYPPATWGGNGVQRYADVAAVRAVENGPAGLGALLCEAAERYGLPLAVTEAHLGCTREEQVRWLVDVWNEAHAARDAGADVQAVTAWALLGSFDWDSLLTDCRGHYEPGPFDARASPPRPTALAATVRALAAGRTPTHPVLDGPGWWARPIRFAHPRTHVAGQPPTRHDAPERRPLAPHAPRPVLILGDGPEALALARLCSIRGLAFEHLGSADALRPALAEHRPWAVVDTLAGGAGPLHAPEPACIDACAAGERARDVAAARAALVTFSSDVVFAPRLVPYGEHDAPCPATDAGRAQAAADRAVLDAHPGALVLRSGPWISPWDPDDALRAALDALTTGDAVTLPAGPAPVYLPALLHAALDLLVDGETGLWHVEAPAFGEPHAELSGIAAMVREAAMRAGLDPAPVAERVGGGAQTRLVSTRGALLDAPGVTLDHFLHRDDGWPAPRPLVSA